MIGGTDGLPQPMRSVRIPAETEHSKRHVATSFLPRPMDDTMLLADGRVNQRWVMVRRHDKGQSQRHLAVRDLI